MGSVNSTITDENLAVKNVKLNVTNGTNGNLSVAVCNPVMVDESKNSSVEPAYHNPHYFASQNLLKENPVQEYEEVKVDKSDVDAVARAYQSLNMTTMDYVSLYSVPGKGREGDIVPKIEVCGKFYAVVNKHKTEQDVYTSLAK